MSTFNTPDERRLEFEVSGPDGGMPLVFHHGTPGSSVQFGALRRSAHERGLRLVTYSRPGYGTSTRRPGRTVADAAADVAALLDHLGAERCLTAGWSGGGPHALATAALLTGRVAGVLVVAGLAPYGAQGMDSLAGMGEANIEEFGKAMQGEAALRTYLEPFAAELRGADADRLCSAMASLLPDVDRAVLTGELAEDLAASFTGALRDGVDGWLDDDLCFIQPWGFAPEEIRVPVFVWQGSDDLMVPHAHGQWLAEHLPSATAHLLEGEGHLSLVTGLAGRMLDELTRAV